MTKPGLELEGLLPQPQDDLSHGLLPLNEVGLMLALGSESGRADWESLGFLSRGSGACFGRDAPGTPSALVLCCALHRAVSLSITGLFSFFLCSYRTALMSCSTGVFRLLCSNLNAFFVVLYTHRHVDTCLACHASAVSSVFFFFNFIPPLVFFFF